MFDELFNVIDSILKAVVIIVIVAVVSFVIWLVWDAKKTEERNRVKAVEDANRQRIQLETEKKRKRIYLEGLRKIYDHRSTADLQKMYTCLETMHYNNYTPGFDKECTPGTLDAHCEAHDRLLALLGRPAPHWKYLLKDGKIGDSDRCLRPTDDMNYVYQLLMGRR